MQSIFLKTTLRLGSLFLATSALIIVSLSFAVNIEVKHYLGRIQADWLLIDESILSDLVLHHAAHQRILTDAGDDFQSAMILTTILIFMAAGVANYFLAKWILKPVRSAMWARKRFTMDAAHDLRTPISIMTSMQETELRRPNLTIERARGLLKSNLEELARMSEITEDLLTLSGIDNKKSAIDFQPVDLLIVVSDVIGQMRLLAEKKGVQIVMQDSEAGNVRGDATMLSRMVMNILKNAIVYTPEGGTIAVGVRRVGGKMECYFSDTGIGIAKEHIPHIFDRFYKVDRARRNHAHGGSGLGLAIVQEIAMKHGANVTVESEIGRGTSIKVDLALYA